MELMGRRPRSAVLGGAHAKVSLPMGSDPLHGSGWCALTTAGRGTSRTLSRVFTAVVVLILACAPSTGNTPSAPSATGPLASAITGPCPVTTPPPAALTPPPPPAATGPNAGLPFRAGSSEFLYGNGALVVALPNDGTIHPSDPSRGLPGGVKFGWERIARGDLVVATRRLDAVTVPQAADVPGGYGDTGLQVSGLNFPSPGCWQVSGTVDGKTVAFVVIVATR